MNIVLSNRTIVLDTDTPIENPRTAAIRWLREYNERKDAMKPPIEEMTVEQCYAELDWLSDYRRDHGRGHSPDAYQARHYCTETRKKVKARLRKLGAPLTRPGDRRVYGPGQTAWQRAGR